MAGVAVDQQAMRDAQRILQGLRLGVYVPRLAQLVAAGGVKLTMDCFRKQQDPYGKAWQPLAKERMRDKHARQRAQARGKKSRGHLILVDTARMRNSTAPINMGRTVGVGIPTVYAAVHQNGAHIAPHHRAASYSNVTYHVGNRFASESQAKKAAERGQDVIAKRYSRTYSQGITIPQRMMLPDADRGLPATWVKMIQVETTSLFKRWVEKGSRI